MKKISLLIAAIALLLPGCFTENSLSPDFGNPSQNSIQWIQLGENGNPTIEKEVLVAKDINGKVGGVIDYDLSVANIEVFGSLTIPKNSFNGTMSISALFDNRTTSQTFGPSPFEFGKSLVLTLEYKGVNLNGVNPSEIDFYYIGDDGQFYKAEYSSINVDPSTGTLSVVNAKINHFSRWGWAKKATD